MDIRVLIGQRIRERRKELKWTLDQVCEKVGVHKSTIHRYEMGKIQEIKIPVIEAIAEVLEVNYDWLWGQSDLKLIERQDKPLERQEKLLLSYFSRLNPVGVDILMDKIKEAADNSDYVSDDSIR